MKSLRIGRKKLLLGAGLVVLLGVVGGMLFWQQSKTSNERAARNLCVTDEVGASLEGKADMLFQSSELQELQPIVDKAKALPNYEQSATCLYIVTIYDLNSSDAESARTDYTKLEALYKSRDDLGENIRASAISLDELKTRLEVVEKQAEQIQKNRSYYQMPTPEDEKRILGE